MGLSEKTLKLAQEWIKWDPNEKTRKAIEILVEQENEEELRRLLWNRIDFGTAGNKICYILV